MALGRDRANLTLWGLGAGMNTFFAAISLGAAVAIVLWSCRPRAAREGFLCVSLGLILAGTLDRDAIRAAGDANRAATPALQPRSLSQLLSTCLLNTTGVDLRLHRGQYWRAYEALFGAWSCWAIGSFGDDPRTYAWGVVLGDDAFERGRDQDLTVELEQLAVADRPRARGVDH